MNSKENVVCIYSGVLDSYKKGNLGQERACFSFSLRLSLPIVFSLNTLCFTLSLSPSQINKKSFKKKKEILLFITVWMDLEG